MKRRISRSLGFYLFLLAILSLCFAPLLMRTFGFADDYDALVMERPYGALLRLCFLQGRWIDAVFIHAMFCLATRVGDLRGVRFCGIAADALLAGMIVRAMRRAGWPLIWGICLALVVATLPAAQILVGWAIEYGIPLSGVLAGLAVELTMISLAAAGNRRTVLIAFALVAMCAAVLIYQSCAMFYWFFLAVAILSPSRATLPTNRAMALLAIVGLAPLAIGFLAVKIAALLLPHASAGHVMGLATDPVGKARWFVCDPLPMALNQAKLVPSPLVASGVALLIVIGLPLSFHGSAAARLRWFGIAALLVPLAYLVNLVVAESYNLYRTQFPLEALIAFYLLLAIVGIARALRLPQAIPLGIVCLWTAGSLALAFLHVQTEIAQPQAAEWKFTRDALAAAPLNRISTIDVILATPDDSCAPYLRTDEFGVPSACLPGMARNEIRLALGEMGVPQKAMRVIRSPEEARDCEWLVDFREIRRLRQ